MNPFPSYSEIISLENLFCAWNSFRKGKRKKRDVILFERNVEDNIFRLHDELNNKTYKHSRYTSFYVNDPKCRHIHKAIVRDRIIHQALYNYLYQIFDKKFIFDSYSCRIEKGTHRGVKRLFRFATQTSKNNTIYTWALKLDINKFFASVDHKILLNLIKIKVKDKNIIWLLEQVINSFETGNGKGIPLGNLTSQIFSNIYLNELDQYVKYVLGLKYYIRYADDFIILSNSRNLLYPCIDTLKQYLREKLNLELHPKKIILRRLEWGIDFLGYVVLPYGIILPRTKTKKRLIKNIEIKTKKFYKGKIENYSLNQTLQSYLGYLKHSNSYNLQREILNSLEYK